LDRTQQQIPHCVRDDAGLVGGPAETDKAAMRALIQLEPFLRINRSGRTQQQIPHCVRDDAGLVVGPAE